MDANRYFKDKKITVMGVGLLGGVGNIAYLARSGADLIVTDPKSEDEAHDSLQILRAFPQIHFTLGRHDLADFRGRDLVIKAPSTPLDSPYIAEARKEGTPVTMWAALFARLASEAGTRIVGVTGTRGKTTVTEMVAAILRQSGRQVIEGGNLRGTSILAELDALTSDTIAVLELDSWKLQGFGEEQISPHIAVFTTFYQDHVNYYKDHPEQYLADKANIFLYQQPEDVLVLGKQCAPLIIEAYGERIESRVEVTDELALPDTWRLRIPGLHNRYNAALALAAARALGIADDTSRAALEAFAGVPGRLEFLREVNGVKIYNDNNSTTPEATLAALAALNPARTVLIIGGSDKNLDMSALVAHLPEAKTVVALAGTGTERIKSDLPAGTAVYHNLADAAAAARRAAESGDTILFSPAFASFGMFKNEYDRNDQFVALVNAL